MELTIAEVARIAGTTSRTLRHYDDVGLLAPSRLGANGYRYYDEDNADWTFAAGDFEESLYSGEGIDVDAGGAYARLTITHALDWIPWSPF